MGDGWLELLDMMPAGAAKLIPEDRGWHYFFYDGLEASNGAMMGHRAVRHKKSYA